MRILLCTFVVVALAGCKKDAATPPAAGGSGTATASGSAAAPAPAPMPATGSGTGARPGGITDELLALTAKVAAAAGTVVAELNAANGDCDKMATVLTAGADKLKPDTDALGAKLDKLDEASTAWFGEHMVGDLTKAFEAMDPILATCKDHAGVVDAARGYLKTLTGE